MFEGATFPTDMRLLLLTIGFGDRKKPEETLYEPLKKTVNDGNFTRVIFLPSKVTDDTAKLLQEMWADIPIEIKSLPEPGNEDDADACFAHYNNVIEEILSTGVERESIVIDFTRGTKAMSAGLVLAAVRHDIHELRYITGPRTDQGHVIPGYEKIDTFSPDIANGYKRLDSTRRFMKEGNFSGALNLLDDEDMKLFWPPQMSMTVAALQSWSEFYAAWDRLDYEAAHTLSGALDITNDDSWADFEPGASVKDWIKALASPEPDENAHDYNKQMSVRLKRIATDLLANGLRRIEHHQYEDAFIRSYRVLELLGQISLFDLGFDTANLPEPEDNQKIAEFIKHANRRNKDKSRPVFSRERGKLVASRYLAARFLKFLDNPLGQELINLADDRDLPIKDRNVSVLIHGFRAIASSDEKRLRAIYDRLRDLLTGHFPETDDWLTIIMNMGVQK